MSLDQDLITFVKWAMGIGGAILVFFGWFFGVDVAKTRSAMLDAREDIAKRLEAIRLDHQSLIELKERLEKLGAELVEQIEKKTPTEPPPPSRLQPAPDQDTEPKETNQDGALAKAWRLKEAKRIHLRQVISAAEFEWTTLGTLAKKTGFTENEIIALTFDDPFVQRGVGRQGQTLLRLRHHNDPNAVRAVLPIDAGPLWGSALWEHLQQGKEPIRKGD